MTTQEAPKVNASLDGRLYLDSANGMKYCQQHDLFFGVQGCWNCASPIAKDKEAQFRKLTAPNAKHVDAMQGGTKGSQATVVVTAAPAESLDDAAASESA